MPLQAKLPNVQDIGYGYDILHGNPIAYTAEQMVPGFKRPLFEFAWNQTVYGNDSQPYLVPYGVTVMNTPSTQFQSESALLTDLDLLETLVQAQVSVSASVPKAAFGLSGYMQKFVKQETAFVHVQSACEWWKVDLDVSTLPSFTADFAKTVLNLPASYEAEAYLGFVQGFGTHYLTSMLLGGRAQQQYLMSRSQYQWLASEGVNVAQSAQVSWFAEFGEQVHFGYNKTQYAMFNRTASQEQLFTLGGLGTLLPARYGEWVLSVQSNPVPVWYSLSPIYGLFTPALFPEDPAIQAKSANMQQAVQQYYANQPVQPCPANCSGHGTCIPSYFGVQECKCDAGWDGYACQNVSDYCPTVKGGVCSGHGLCWCNEQFVCSCSCNWGWTGSDCSQQEITGCNWPWDGFIYEPHQVVSFPCDIYGAVSFRFWFASAWFLPLDSLLYSLDCKSATATYNCFGGLCTTQFVTTAKNSITIPPQMETCNFWIYCANQDYKCQGSVEVLYQSQQ